MQRHGGRSTRQQGTNHVREEEMERFAPTPNPHPKTSSSSSHRLKEGSQCCGGGDGGDITYPTEAATMSRALPSLGRSSPRRGAEGKARGAADTDAPFQHNTTHTDPMHQYFTRTGTWYLV